MKPRMIAAALCIALYGCGNPHWYNATVFTKSYTPAETYNTINTTSDGKTSIGVGSTSDRWTVVFVRTDGDVIPMDVTVDQWSKLTVGEHVHIDCRWYGIEEVTTVQ